MKKIGLIGEDPNDTTSIKNLLNQKHSKDFQFKQLLKNKKGSDLDNHRTSAALEIEYADYKPNYIIFIRDADALITETAKLKVVIDWFDQLNKKVENKGILLMNIFELEALILADISTFNKIYRTNISFPGTVEYQQKPKEFLKSKTFKLKKKYLESDCPMIFSQLQLSVILKNCKTFREFYNKLVKPR